MKRNYEGVYILKLQGQEESVDEVIGTISNEIEAEGATLKQIDRIGKKEFAHENYAKQKHGYYVNVHFESDSSAIDKVQTKLALNKEIMLQYYSRKS